MKRVLQQSGFIPILRIFVLSFFLLSLFRIGLVFISNINSYTEPYYDEKNYKNLENAFNHSQYRLKNNTAVIPDETVYSYAAGAYLRGVDPILINSERTPLGKYFISLSILFLKNDRFVVIPFCIFTIISLWILSAEVLNNKLLATLPVSLFVSEKLFINQLSIAPLLDIIHLPFILLTLIFFIRGFKGHSYWKTAILVGIVMATKTVYSGLLLILVFGLFLFFQKKTGDLVKFSLNLPLAFLTLTLSYLRTFMDGYNLYDFLRFQKWILLYDQSKILFPLSIWRLVFLNQWQAWWGNMGILKADDWSVTWPVFTGLATFLIIFGLFKKIKITREAQILILWFVVYGAFLSVGVASSRFLLLLLPVEFILGTYLLKAIFPDKLEKL